MQIQKIKKNNGQVMMIVIMVLSGVIIGATAVAGLLTVRQIRQTADAGSFSKALFAADAGFEWRMYKFSDKADNYVCKNCAEDDPSSQDEGQACSERPLFDDQSINLFTDCAKMIETPANTCSEDFICYTISSSVMNKGTSYIVSADIKVPK